MRRLVQIAVAAILPMLVPSGGAAENGKCANGFLCADTTAALECKNGVWVKLPCKGTGGCKREGDMIKCDMGKNEENDNCASSAQGRGLCTQDMKGTLECREGKLVKTNSCRSCSVTGDQVVCSP